MTTTPTLVSPALGRGPHYYRHSGRLNLMRLAPGLAAAALSAVVMAAAYAYLDLYIPIGGWVTFIMTLGLGFGVGAVTARVLEWAHCRNDGATFAAAAGMGVLAWVASWYVYIFALLEQVGRHANPVAMLLHPGADLNIIETIARHGAWSIDGVTPSGPVLWLLWIVEAGLIIVPAVRVPVRRLASRPFCEHCHVWGTTRHLANLNPAPVSEVRRNLEAGDFVWLTSVGPLNDASNRWLDLSLQGCSKCDTTQTLTVEAAQLTVDNRGRRRIKRGSIIRHLLLTPEQTVALATVVATLKHAPEAESIAVADATATPADSPALTAAGPSPETPAAPASGDAGART